MWKAFLNWLTVSGGMLIAAILIAAVIIASIAVGSMLLTGFQNHFGSLRSQKVLETPDS
jgi:hypothetical protein